jgi:hypothetical protein
MFSAMQYTQRKSHRSVTDIRRYEMCRPKRSTSGLAMADGMVMSAIYSLAILFQSTRKQKGRPDGGLLNTSAFVSD